jgi:hypothetical protein
MILSTLLYQFARRCGIDVMEEIIMHAVYYYDHPNRLVAVKSQYIPKN